MRHAEITGPLLARIKAWQASGYSKTMASLALEVSVVKLAVSAPGYWGRRQLPKGLLRRFSGNYFVPPMMAGLHERFRRYVSKEPAIELELVYRLLAVDARQFPIVARWLAYERSKVAARRTLANKSWRIWEAYRDEGKAKVAKPVPAQLVGSRWYEKHPEWKLANQRPTTESMVTVARATFEQVARDKIASDQVRRNKELAALLWVNRVNWT